MRRRGVGEAGWGRQRDHGPRLGRGSPRDAPHRESQRQPGDSPPRRQPDPGQTLRAWPGVQPPVQTPLDQPGVPARPEQMQAAAEIARTLPDRQPGEPPRRPRGLVGQGDDGAGLAAVGPPPDQPDRGPPDGLAAGPTSPAPAVRMCLCLHHGSARRSTRRVPRSLPRLPRRESGRPPGNTHAGEEIGTPLGVAASWETVKPRARRVPGTGMAPPAAGRHRSAGASTLYPRRSIQAASATEIRSTISSGTPALSATSSTSWAGSRGVVGASSDAWCRC